MTTSLIAAAAKPAGGAAIGQVIGATAGAMIATAILLWIVHAHRTGRIKWLGRVAAFAERQTGLAGWAAVPAGMLGISLLVAVFGMYWDISIHLDKGRDPGPLANAAHYFILVGLFFAFFCGIMSIALSPKRPSNTAFELSPNWWAPLGAVMLLATTSVSLLAFPLDDMWHRLFGQDVTLWGPTHLLLFGGASLSVLGAWVLQVEAARARGTAGEPPKETWLQRFRDLSLAGALLIGMSTFQGEFDFGVPQFRLVWHPVLLALAAGVALTAARIRLGRGGAIKAALFFIAIRGGLALIVGAALAHTMPHFPLYLAEAACVEIVGLRFGRNRPLTLGAVSGVLIGTVGFAAEWGWSHVWVYNPWPSSMLGEAIPLALLAGLCGGVLGGFIGRALTPASVPRAPRWVVPAAFAGVIAIAAWCLPMPRPSNPPTAHVSLTNINPGPKRTVAATVHLDPPNAADDARWLDITAWQGGGSVVDHLRKVGPGTYRTTHAIPVYGDWKVTLRLHRGRQVLGVPVYFPADPAIPAKAIPAEAQFTHRFDQDKKLLQREQKPGVSGVLTTAAYMIVLAIALAVLGLLGWGLRRISQEIGTVPPPSRSGERGRRRFARPDPRVAAASR